MKVTVPVGATLAVTAAVKVIVLLDENDHTTVDGDAVTVTVAVGGSTVTLTLPVEPPNVVPELSVPPE